MYDENVMARFWEKVNKNSGYTAPHMITECWIWTAATFQKGYGVFGLNGKTWRANRFVYTAIYGEIPANLIVCHHCDNTKCVRPDHLFLGTPKDNTHDMMVKGRYNTVPKDGNKRAGRPKTKKRTATPQGVIEPKMITPPPVVEKPKITIEQAFLIRTTYALKRMTVKEIAKRYCIPLSVVSHILNHKVYIQIED